MKDSYIWYTDKLNEEYKSVFEQVELYVSTQNIDQSISEERMGDLLDIFLSAQDAGKPVQKIVGNNLEAFCKTFCSDFGMKNHILRILDSAKFIAWFLAIISTLDILDAVSTSNFRIGDTVSVMNVSVYLVIIFVSEVLAAITNMILRAIMFKTKRISIKALRMVSLMIGCAAFVIALLILFKSNTELFDIPAWIIAFCAWVYLLFYYFFVRKKLHKNEMKQPKVRFFDLVKEDVQKEMDREMEKKFKKAKEKNLKKRKKELSLEEFLDRKEKSCNKTEKLKFFNYLLPIVVTLISYIYTYLMNGFETYADSIFFILIMLAVEYPILIGIWKIEKNGVEVRRAWIRTKRSEMKEKKEIDLS